jgi:type I restriction enzyme S subunit
MFQSDIIQRQVRIAISSAVQGNLFQDSIRMIRVPLPPSSTDEQENISKIFEIIDNKITEENLKLYRTGRLKKSLMQNLLTGVIPVKNNGNDQRT